MVLAIFNPLRNIWDIKFKKGGKGYDLIETAIEKTKAAGDPYFKVHETMKDLYRLHGFLPGK